MFEVHIMFTGLPEPSNTVKHAPCVGTKLQDHLKVLSLSSIENQNVKSGIAYLKRLVFWLQ